METSKRLTLSKSLKFIYYVACITVGVFLPRYFLIDTGELWELLVGIVALVTGTLSFTLYAIGLERSSKSIKGSDGGRSIKG